MVETANYISRKTGRLIREIAFIDDTRWSRLYIMLMIILFFLFSAALFIIPPIYYLIDEQFRSSFTTFIIVTFIFYIVSIILIITVFIPYLLSYKSLGPMKIYENGFIPPSPIYIDKKRTNKIFILHNKFIWYKDIDYVIICDSNRQITILRRTDFINKDSNEVFNINSLFHSPIEHIKIISNESKPPGWYYIINSLIFDTPNINDYHMPLYIQNKMEIKSFIMALINKWFSLNKEKPIGDLLSVSDRM